MSDNTDELRDQPEQAERPADAGGGGADEPQQAAVHHSVWSYSCDQPRQAVMGTGTGWASAFFPPAGMDPSAATMPASGSNQSQKASSVESVIGALEHKIAVLQQDLAHSWGHLNDWKKRLAQEQSDVTLRCQDLDNKEKMLRQLASDLEERDVAVGGRETELAQLDQDLHERLCELGHAEVLTFARELEEREIAVKRFSAQYDDKRAELEAIKESTTVDRASAQQDRAAAERLLQDIHAREQELDDRERELHSDGERIERLSCRLHGHQEDLVRREQELDQRQAKFEQIAKKLEARRQELGRNEEALHKRSEVLQRFGGFLQEAIRAYDGTVDFANLPDHPLPPAGSANGSSQMSDSSSRVRLDMEATLKELEREARNMMWDFSSRSDISTRNDLPGRPSDMGHVVDSAEDEVKEADSLNTHLFRRIRHSRGSARTQGQETDRPWDPDHSR